MLAGSPGGNKIMPPGRGADSRKSSAYGRSMQSEGWKSVSWKPKGCNGSWKPEWCNGDATAPCAKAVPAACCSTSSWPSPPPRGSVVKGRREERERVDFGAACGSMAFSVCCGPVSRAARCWTTDSANEKSTCCPRRSTMGKYLVSKPCGSAVPQCKMFLARPCTCALKALIFLALCANFHVFPSNAANTLAALDGSVKLTKANPTLQRVCISHGTETKLMASLGTCIDNSISTSETVYFRGKLRIIREVTCSLSQASSACPKAA
mmetsp:Transcript_148019/g.475273  ORF Transcript_148019/g.475273 Transcript_148019/m.475273 type:complete len:265 (-) Transcript_148019:203-997(-)